MHKDKAQRFFVSLSFLMNVGTERRNQKDEAWVGLGNPSNQRKSNDTQRKGDKEKKVPVRSAYVLIIAPAWFFPWWTLAEPLRRE